MTRRPLDIRVVSASVRGTEIYRDGVFTRPDLIAQCQAALLRPVTTPTPIALPAPEEQPRTG